MHRSSKSIGAIAASLFGVEPPRPRLEAVRVVDMTSSNSWAEFAALMGYGTMDLVELSW